MCESKVPGMPVIFMSGYPASCEIVAGLTARLTARGVENVFTYLQKPFTPQDRA